MSKNDQTIRAITKVIDIFTASEAEIRPHFVLTGPSGCGKSHVILQLADDAKIPMIEVNAAQLTKEGTSGNSLSKALVPLMNYGDRQVICFVDEFDKLFISGNSNSQLAHETTNGVQNEFLKILEGKTTSIYGDYGKYMEVKCDNVLFVFAGAFNGEEDIDLDRLRAFGIKTEFLGRVGLAFSMDKFTISDLEGILKNSKLLATYLQLFPDVDRDFVTNSIMSSVRDNYELNTIGVRILHTLVHQYFIHGSLSADTVQSSTFQKTLSLDENVH